MTFSLGDATLSINVPNQKVLLDEIERRLSANAGFAIATLNLDHLVKLRADPSFREAYLRQDLITADGNPVVWLSRAAGRPIDLLAGSDLIRPILRLAARVGAPVGFLGSTEVSLDAAAAALMSEIPGLDVRARVAPPMGFDPASPQALRLLDDMAAQGVRLVLLALGAPKQECLAALGRLRQPGLGFLSIGAGLDFIAGSQRRAPPWLRVLALEWLWRLLLSPRRLAARYLDCALILPGLFGRALAQRSAKGGLAQSLLLRTSEVMDAEDSFLRLPRT